MNRSPDNPNPSRRGIFARLSTFRARLVTVNILITLVAITGMAYYVYYRAQETNRYLTTELVESVRQKAEETLANTGDEHAAELSGFFHDRADDVVLVGGTVHNLLQREYALKGGTLWNANLNLQRLPNGSWDNPNEEPSSIFIPASQDLTTRLSDELNTIKYTETTLPLVLEAHHEIIAIYFGGVAGETIYFPNIDLANIVPPDFDVTQRPWFVAATPLENPKREVVWSEPYQDAALNGFVVTSSVPVFDASGIFRGVAAMDIQLNTITDVVANIRVGETGYAFLIDKDHRLIAFPEAGYSDFNTSPEALPLGEVVSREQLAQLPEQLFAALDKMAAGESGLIRLEINGAESFMVYRPISQVGYSLAIVVPTDELLAGAEIAREQIAIQTQNTIRFSIFLVGAILVGAFFVALVVGNTMTAPLKALTQTAEEITHGNLEARAETRGQDEIGILGQALNTMTTTLSSLIQSLEQRVAERTADLETARLVSEKRVRELQVIGKISGVVASEQKLDSLLPLVTSLVSEQFDFYHVGIFLLDETRQFAVLQAANSEGGQKMLARGHRLRVGETGIVGYVTKFGEARIALDVGTDAVFFNNPDLPTTRSEMALPLITRGQTIGALDVQSDKPGAFTESDAQTLSILADQIATAIENARLFQQTQEALRETQALYSEYSKKAWKNFAEEESTIGYRQTMTRGSRLSVALDSDEIREAMNRGSVLVFHADGKTEEPEIVVPVKLRGQVIGAIKVKAPTHDRRWSQDEIGLAEAISERLSLALENARLIQDSQRQAIKEQMIGEVTSRIGASINLRSVLQTAVEELGRSIPGSEVVIRFNSENGKDQ